VLISVAPYVQLNIQLKNLLHGEVEIDESMGWVAWLKPFAATPNFGWFLMNKDGSFSCCKDLPHYNLQENGEYLETWQWVWVCVFLFLQFLWLMA